MGIASEEFISSPYAGGAPSLVTEGRLDSSKLMCCGVDPVVLPCPLRLCVERPTLSTGVSILVAALAGLEGLVDRLKMLDLIFFFSGWSNKCIVGEVVTILGVGIAGTGGASADRYVLESAESEACRNLSRENL